jgi:FkbH-like protein
MLLSKNNEDEVRCAIAEVTGMVLGWDDFACRKINFQPKYLNLREAAAELGLGLDSFVFLDDSDYEREQMKMFNPEVLCLNQRSDALHMLDVLWSSDAFDIHQITEEDTQRHRDYGLRSARTMRNSEQSIESFLASLELRATVKPVADDNIARVTQLLGKTNQFNLTTRRHSMDKVRELVSIPNTVGLTLRLADKFGDQGIIGLLIAVPENGSGTMVVDSFLVSCRALGRGVEDVLWSELLAQAARAGVRQIRAEYIRTPKNDLVAPLFDRLGLRRTSESEQVTEYVLDSVIPTPGPAWIARE